MRERKVHEWYLASPPSEGPPRRVRLTRPFALGVTEVTIGQFRRFVREAGYRTDAERDGKGGEGRIEGRWQRRPEFHWNRIGYRQRDDEPVVNVTWRDADAFCRWLSRKEGRTYRLPTEAEWEYACRAGTTTRFYWGDDAARMDEYAWHGGNSNNGPHPVSRRKPNAWGLYDMSGGVYEYCRDFYASDAYRTSGNVDPRGPATGTSHVVRSGSWGTLGIHCRSAFRGDGESLDHRNQRDGFRVACESSPPS
jgi:formylglycine-generating enzyme required for sulfatase activity